MNLLKSCQNSACWRMLTLTLKVCSIFILVQNVNPVQGVFSVNKARGLDVKLSLVILFSGIAY